MKKVWILIPVLLGSLLLGGCATVPKAPIPVVAPQERSIVFGDGKVILPAGVPDFGSFRLLQRFPLYESDNLIIMGGEGQGVENSREFVLLVVAIERHGDTGKVFLLAFQYSQLPEGKDPVSHAYIDKTYMETGTYSGVFVEVNKIPDVKKFIALRTQQLLKKTGI
jgi:hypothetical protein